VPPVPIEKEAGWDPEPIWTLWRKFKILYPVEIFRILGGFEKIKQKGAKAPKL
jgi:hypothetical protein